MAHKALSPTERLPTESDKAFYAYTRYRDAGPAHRSLAQVTQARAAEQAVTGLRIVGQDAANKPPRKSGHDGQIGLWSRKFKWAERVKLWDAIVDQRVRETQLDQIQRMSKRHAQQCQVSLEMLIAPVMAFLTGMRDPARARELETEDMVELLKASVFASIHIPKLQQGERLSRGVKVIDTEPISNPASAQDPAVWNVTVHQPERDTPTPEIEVAGTSEAPEWEEI